MGNEAASGGPVRAALMIQFDSPTIGDAVIAANALAMGVAAAAKGLEGGRLTRVELLEDTGEAVRHRLGYYAADPVIAEEFAQDRERVMAVALERLGVRRAAAV